MPELPEVEHVKRGLEPYVKDEVIKDVIFSETVQLAHQNGRAAIVKGTTLDAFRNEMTGRRIYSVSRRSKYLLFSLAVSDEKETMLSHLGMTGAWFVVRSADDISEEKFRLHVHVTFLLESGKQLIYSDIRRFGEVRFLPLRAAHAPLLAIGPEPFDEDAKERFLAAMDLPKFRLKPVKEVIMNHQVIAGCGNIYATEALFQTGIHPKRTPVRMSRQKKEQLFEAIVRVLQQGIDEGGSSISDYRNVNGEAGGMQHRLQMYGRAVCPVCSQPVKQAVIAGRNSHYCSNCQH